MNFYVSSPPVQHVRAAKEKLANASIECDKPLPEKKRSLLTKDDLGIEVEILC